MATRLVALLLTLVLTVPPALAAEPDDTTAETYRQAAEKCRGIALEERTRRKGLELELEDEKKRSEAWRSAAKERLEPRTPEWLWPAFTLAAIAAFAGGFLLAHQDRRQ